MQRARAGRVGGDDDLVSIRGGTYRLGSDRHYPEEAPARDVRVEAFAIERYPVTNARFARFVATTTYVTVAERPIDLRDIPGSPIAEAPAGSLVFVPTPGPVALDDASQWWRYVPGASWRAPEGPGSDLAGRDDHPVVHVAYADAEAFAAWAGRALPSEAQWEAAARGGLDGATFTWGDAREPGGRRMAQTWQGAFPWRNDAPDGHARTAPVGSFPANGFGLYDMAGNVWEWTADWYRARPGGTTSPCCASPDPEDPSPIPRKTLKGGSHLCAPDYCLRFRPAARMPQPVDTGTSHVGFRCIAR
jgi:formylglycine-generating enzyme required for sulfatase activity